MTACPYYTISGVAISEGLSSLYNLRDSCEGLSLLYNLRVGPKACSHYTI